MKDICPYLEKPVYVDLEDGRHLFGIIHYKGTDNTYYLDDKSFGPTRGDKHDIKPDEVTKIVECALWYW